MPNISSVIRNDCCTGCGLCSIICPRDAITMVLDKDGFKVPSVLGECSGCGLCIKKCPVIIQQCHKEPSFCYAAIANNPEARTSGSSGGIFGIIASDYILRKGHVYGASFSKDLILHHSKASSIEELKPLLKSKYIQSDITNIFNQIKDDLNEGIEVLFCGTPCQCNAVINHLGHPSGLTVIDFVCHGVPSQQLFNMNIDWLERKYGGKVISYTFRYKGEGAKHPQAFSFVIEKNGKTDEIVGQHYQDPYYFAFQKHISMRKSCYHCPWAQPNRVGDITLGDFWGIEKLSHSLNSHDGTSMVIGNSPKGVRIIEGLDIIKERYPYHIATKNNDCLLAPTKEPAERETFFNNLRKSPYDKVVVANMTSKRKLQFDLYYTIPSPLRKIIRKALNRFVKYE